MPKPPPAAAKAKPANDIRNFFGGGGSSGSQKSKTTEVIELLDDEDAKPGPSSSAPPQKSRKKHTALAISDSEDEKKPVAAPPKRKGESASSAQKRKKPVPLSVTDDEDDDDKPVPAPPKRKKPQTVSSSDEDESRPTASKKHKSSASASTRSGKRKKPTVVTSDEDEAEESEAERSPPKKQKTSSSSAAKAKPRTSTNGNSKKAKTKLKTDDDGFIVGSSEEEDEPKKKKAPTKGKEKEKETVAKSKPNWAAIKAAKLAGPSAPGSKLIPDGEPNCLSGLAFVFTGELTSLSRDEAVDLAKRFGGRVVGQPSSKTDYVVLGQDAGPKKLEAIKKHKLTTLTEDEFLDLIATKKAPKLKDLDEKTRKKMEKDQAAIQAAAKEMEALVKKKPSQNQTLNPSTQLWTSRYAPTRLADICGNKSQVEKLSLWLKDFPASLKCGFKKPGKNAMNMYRAVLITGPPGIGKTTSAHLCAKLAGYTPIELNASDSRSKKLVENGMNVGNTSLDGFFSGGSKNDFGLTITDRTCLIMDEVDGMSAGDRGGVGALNALIKKSQVPIICIANDRNAQKLKPLQSTTASLPFSRPPPAQVRSRIMSVIFKEKMQVPANVVDQLISGSQSDIRQVLNMLSTWKLSSDKMSFDEGKMLTQMNEKYSTMNPWDITSKMLGPYLFSHTARETLGDKMDLYFQDHSFIPLFIQENYLRAQPSRLRNLEGPEKELKQLELMDKAASSISDGDLVDGMIHGPEQHWGLMPLHAVCSSVRPSSFVYGGGVHYGGQGGMAFPQWLGQNSKQGKLSRQLTEVQARMRLKVSGDKSEIRQSYIPALYPHIVQPLADIGASVIEEVIEKMDDYFISKDDWDTIVELGVGNHKDELVLKKISAGVKTAFTKKYNSGEHPIPYHKATDLGKIPKKLAGGGSAPDLEDAFEVDDVDVGEEEDASEDKNNGEDDDIKKDKLIKAPKKRAAPKAKVKEKEKKK